MEYFSIGTAVKFYEAKNSYLSNKPFNKYNTSIPSDLDM